MIRLQNLAFQSRLDLNVESQTLGFWAGNRKNPHAPRQARICATHGPSAAEYVSPLWGRSQWRTQGQRLLVSGSVHRHGIRPVDLPRVPACHRSQLARPSQTAVPHGVSLSDDFAQHDGQCERHRSVRSTKETAASKPAWKVQCQAMCCCAKRSIWPAPVWRARSKTLGKSYSAVPARPRL